MHDANTPEMATTKITTKMIVTMNKVTSKRESILSKTDTIKIAHETITSTSEPFSISDANSLSSIDTTRKIISKRTTNESSTTSVTVATTQNSIDFSSITTVTSPIVESATNNLITTSNMDPLTKNMENTISYPNKRSSLTTETSPIRHSVSTDSLNTSVDITAIESFTTGLRRSSTTAISVPIKQSTKVDTRSN